MAIKYEASKADKKSDKGRKEGSKSDMKADKRAMSKPGKKGKGGLLGC